MAGMVYLLRALGVLWAYGRWWVVSSFLIYLLQGLLPLATLWVTRELVNAVAQLIESPTQDAGAVLKLVLLEFSIVALSAVFRNLKVWIDARVEVVLDHELQKKIADKVARVPLAYFELPRFYHHLSRVNSGIGGRLLRPVKTMFEMFQTTITLVSFLGFLLGMHWSFVAISFLAAAPTLLIQAHFGQQRFWMLLHQTPLAREAGYMRQLTMDRQAIKETRMFGLTAYLIRRWSDRFLKNANEALKLTGRQQRATAGLEMLSGIFYMGAAGVMVWLARQGSLRIGDFVSMGQAVRGAQTSINVIAMHLSSIYEQMLYIRDYFLFLEFDEPELAEMAVRGNRMFPAMLEQGVSFENVYFRYPDTERDVLQDVTFTMQPGEKVAIVGENGSGKTTLVKCLMGLFPLSGGQIRFDGIDLMEISEEQLYRHMTVIYQDFMKYDLTVRENILFGDIERSDDLETFEWAAKKAGVDRLIERLEKGYDTHLGRSLFDGEDVSGGQWQKIAIARALFRGGQIMVLDEPTAALDPLAEMEVFRQYAELTEGRTAVFISHRMASARMADRIIVMKDGRVAEIGSHEELFALDGEYARMYRMQAQWYADEPEQTEELIAWTN